MHTTTERAVAEEIIAGIYRHIGRERPRLACRLKLETPHVDVS